MIDKKFGLWTVIDGPFDALNGYRLYLCRCKCGIKRHVYRSNLVNGISRGCRECRNKRMQIVFEEGEVIGSWTVIGPPLRGKFGKWCYPCICTCGKRRKVIASMLNLGLSKRCQECSRSLKLKNGKEEKKKKNNTNKET